MLEDEQRRDEAEGTVRQLARDGVIPAALPQIFVGLKWAAVNATVGATIGEWIGGDAGQQLGGREEVRDAVEQQVHALVKALGRVDDAALLQDLEPTLRDEAASGLLPGDLVLAPHDCYGGTHRLLTGLNRRGACRVEFVDWTAQERIEGYLARRPRLVLLETPSNRRPREMIIASPGEVQNPAYRSPLRLFPLSFRARDAGVGLGDVELVQIDGEWYGILVDPHWWSAVWNTFRFAVVSVSIETVLGLLIALVLHASFRGRGLVRAAVLIPWAIPTIVSAKMWGWMLHDQFGILNDMLLNIGLIDQAIAWTADPDRVMAAVIMVDVWKTTPFMALLLLAALQLLPKDCYEAARVDGIHPVRVFFRVTLPLIWPAGGPM